jgi:putative redox protein
MPEAESGMQAEGTVLVSETGAGKFQQSITAGHHEFFADEPASVGGGDIGPGPYDLLLAALGSCTAMTIRLYADRHAMKLENVSVSLRHQRVHEVDAAREGKTRLERITRNIRLVGGLSPEERARLIDVANRCPVHRTLTGNVEIDTREAG